MLYKTHNHSASSRGGLVVQHLLHKKCHWVTVDRNPLGTTIYIPSFNLANTFVIFFRLVPINIDVTENLQSSDKVVHATTICRLLLSGMTLTNREINLLEKNQQKTDFE